MSYLETTRPPAISGHVRRAVGKRRVTWYAKYRAPDPTAPGGVRQVQKMLGPEWPHDGPPPPDFYDQRKAQAELEAILTDARRGVAEVTRTGVSFERLAQDWLTWGRARTRLAARDAARPPLVRAPAPGAGLLGSSASSSSARR